MTRFQCTRMTRFQCARMTRFQCAQMTRLPLPNASNLDKERIITLLSGEHEMTVIVHLAQ